MVPDEEYLRFMSKVGFISQKCKVPGDIVVEVLNAEVNFINSFERKAEKRRDENGTT